MCLIPIIQLVLDTITCGLKNSSLPRAHNIFGLQHVDEFPAVAYQAVTNPVTLVKFNGQAGATTCPTDCR